MDKTISVVLPTYNRAHLLKRAVDSVLTQTFQDFELIVVDDGSTDNTEEVLSSYCEDRIKVIKLAHNVGPSRARNIGIESSNGLMVAFHDSDDKWLPNKLEVQLEAMRQPDTTRMVGCCFTRLVIERDGVQARYIPEYNEKALLNGDIYSRLLQGNIVDTPTMLIRRDVLQDVGGFDETLVRLEDWDLALRIAVKYDFVFVHQPLLVSYWSVDGVNNRTDIKSVYRILYKNRMGFRKYHRDWGAELFWTNGDQLMKNGNTSLGIKSLFTSVRLSPRYYTVLALFGALFGSYFYRRLSSVFAFSR